MCSFLQVLRPPAPAGCRQQARSTRAFPSCCLRPTRDAFSERLVCGCLGASPDPWWVYWQGGAK
ncbi:hypothetical protein E2C01_059520 [Portunus trituberculatus]|uniref:Uncharacterized protein n=1 Tax=Portunus trituberculatus TaxID=210409 RepID=A0A5B7H631_PORTR|nr:hypothetical protein [Portunus trituberculatus]